MLVSECVLLFVQSASGVRWCPWQSTDNVRQILDKRNIIALLVGATNWETKKCCSLWKSILYFCEIYYFQNKIARIPYSSVYWIQFFDFEHSHVHLPENPGIFIFLWNFVWLIYKLKKYLRILNSSIWVNAIQSNVIKPNEPLGRPNVPKWRMVVKPNISENG